MFRSPTTSPKITKYQILLAARPLNILYTLSNAEVSSINWNDNGGFLFRHALPSLLNITNFRTHIAVVLIQESIWFDQRKTLLARFRQGHFFEHLGKYGSSKVISEDRRWDDEDIKKIFAIEQVGWTTASLKNIYQSFCLILYNNNLDKKFVYYNALWWNCHDVAIFLSYLVDESNVSARKLPEIYVHLNGLRHKLLRDEKEKLNIYCAKGYVAFAVVAKVHAIFGASGFAALVGGGILITNPWAIALGMTLWFGVAVSNILVPVHNIIGSYRRRIIVDFLQERDARLMVIGGW